MVRSNEYAIFYPSACYLSLLEKGETPIMNRICLLVALLPLAFALSVSAAEIQVEQGVITTGIMDRNPVDVQESYPSAVGRLLCFTRITGADGDTVIYHVWYRGGKEMSRVELPVRSVDWRTWSSKTILPEWKGEWKVDVLDAQGKTLKTIHFSLF